MLPTSALRTYYIGEGDEKHTGIYTKYGEYSSPYPAGRARGRGVLQPRTRFAGEDDALLQPKSNDVTQISGDRRLSLLFLGRDAEVTSRDNLVNRYRAV
jgi:hypothetical protein